MSDKSERLFDGVTHVDDDLIESAKPMYRKRWRPYVAAVVVLAILIALPWIPWRGSSVVEEQSIVDNAGGNYVLARAVYPVMASYPNEKDYVNHGEYDDEALMAAYKAWREDVNRQLDQPAGYADGLEGYIEKSLAAFLDGSDGENRLFSPLNVYMALSMLAEITDGDSRAQILDLLGSDSIEKLRAQAKSVWNANYRDDGVSKSVLANSLWLRNDVETEPDTVKTLAENYYASVYSGEMGSESYDQLLQDWLNAQTGGLLEDAAAGEGFDPRTCAALASALYYQARWYDEFIPANNREGVFHGAQGDQNAVYLYQEHTQTVYWGAHFMAVSKVLSDDHAMWFLLPDEDVTPEQLLQDPEVMQFLRSGESWQQQKGAVVHLSVPKFDVTAQVSLLDGLRQLGVTDVCDPIYADFTPLLPTEEGAFLSGASHAVRVTVDEQGVTAAAYTLMAMSGEGIPPEDEIDFTLDRPFIFAVTGDQNLPLFTGIVNHM